MLLCRRRTHSFLLTLAFQPWLKGDSEGVASISGLFKQYPTWMALLACGLSQQTNWTPLSIKEEMNATLRLKRSSFAITSVAFFFGQRERGHQLRSVPVELAAVDLCEFRQGRVVAEKAQHNVFLGIESQFACPLLLRGDTVVGHMLHHPRPIRRD